MASRPLQPLTLSRASSLSNLPSRKRRRADRPRAAKAAKRPRATPPSERLEDVVVRNVLMSPTSVKPGFLLKSDNVVINDHVREIVVDWLMEVAAEYHARPQTLALAVSYMDRVLEKMPIDRENIQLLAIVCMLIACKIEETDPPSVADIIFICDYTYAKSEVYDMETRVLVQLDFRLTYPTHLNVVNYIAKTMRCSSKRVTQVAEFAAHVALMDARLASESVGVVALGCIMVAMRIEKLDASCLNACPDSVLEKCGKESGAAALRVIEMWCKLRKRHHDADQSRWLFLEWPDIADMLVIVAEKEGDGRKKKLTLKES